MKVVDTLDLNKLSTQQKNDALCTDLLLKEKRCGKLEGRTCADGNKQRPCISKEDSLFPTVLIESLINILVIDAQEGREIATANVMGSYLNTDMGGFLSMKIEGNMVDYMVQADQKNTLIMYAQLTERRYCMYKYSRPCTDELSLACFGIIFLQRL